MQEFRAPGHPPVYPKTNCSFWPSWRGNTLFTILITVLVLVLVAWLVALTRQSLLESKRIGQADSSPHTITIDAEGKIMGTPDIAQIELGFEVTKPDVVSAQRESTEKMNALIAALKNMSVEAEDIQTINYYIRPDYDYGESGRIFKGYFVSQDVRVKIRDLAKVSDVLAVAGQMGLNQIGGLSFAIDDIEVIRDEARAKAIWRAEQKAEGIAKMLNAKLGTVVGFSESNIGVPAPRYGYAEALSLDMGGGGQVPQIEAGSLEVIVGVYITYELE